MGSQMFQLLVLAAIAVFLIVKLRSVLGTRDGFEPERDKSPNLTVIEGGPDHDIADFVDINSSSATALKAMKDRDENFTVSDFIAGARGAYEMILMAFENGDLSEVRDFLDDDVESVFQGAIDARKEQGLTVEANFIGLSETTLKSARFDKNLQRAEIDVKFTCEITSVVKDQQGNVLEGSDTEIKRQRDIWTFARDFRSTDPNWQLVDTAE